MPIAVYDAGANNALEISPAALERGSGRIALNGNNNFVTIRDSAFDMGVNITLSGNAFLEIGRNINAAHLVLYLGPDSEATIGEAVSCNGLVRFMVHERASIRVGDLCLFGSEVDVTASDMHSIVDAATGRRINPAASVTIGKRVWVGQKATILKGVTIGDGAVVGASAVVTRDVPALSVAAGNPARIVKTGVTWDFRLL